MPFKNSDSKKSRVFVNSSFSGCSTNWKHDWLKHSKVSYACVLKKNLDNFVNSGKNSRSGHVSKRLSDSVEKCRKNVKKSNCVDPHSQQSDHANMATIDASMCTSVKNDSVLSNIVQSPEAHVCKNDSV